MRDFPDASENDYNLGLSSKDAKTITHIAYSIWNDRSKVRSDILKRTYDHFGVKNNKEYENVIKKHGKLSKTKYEKLSIGRTKIRRLLGEFLEMGFDSNVFVTNKEAVNAKMDKYLDLLTLSSVKPQIETVRAMGIPAYKGVKIPDANDDDTWDPKKLKLDAEILMQVLLSKAMEEQMIKLTFYNSLEKFLINSEAHSKVERTSDGTDNIRAINPLDAIYIEIDNDYFCEKTPIKGERRFMTRSSIMQEYSELKGLKDKLDKLSGSAGSDEYDRNKDIYTNEIGFDVIIVEVKSFDEFYEKRIKMKNGIKKTFEISKEERKKNSSQINYDIKNGKYELVKMYRPSIYEIASINGADWLLKCEKTESTVLLEGKNGKYYPEFDYKSIIMPKVGGERVSLQTICSKIERVVDQAVYSIKKEMNRPSGDALGFNGGALPKGKTLAGLIHDISEDTIFEFESSGERNQSGIDMDAREVFVNAKLGNMDKLRYLIDIKTNMELTLDSITGINDAREGFTKATSTATTAGQNLDASRSATYEIFFLFGLFTKKNIVHIINKMKSNPEILYGNNDSLLLSDSDIGILRSTRELIMYDYGAMLTDGRRESNVMNKMERFFEFELNAGTLRSEDVARFFQADSFGKAIKVIDTAREDIEKQKSEEAQREQKGIQTQEKAKTDRELNKQANELDKTVLKGKVQEEVDDNEAENERLVNQSNEKEKAIAESEQRLSQKNPDGIIGRLKQIEEQYGDIEI